MLRLAGKEGMYDTDEQCGMSNAARAHPVYKVACAWLQ